MAHPFPSAPIQKEKEWSSQVLGCQQPSGKLLYGTTIDVVGTIYLVPIPIFFSFRYLCNLQVLYQKSFIENKFRSSRSEGGEVHRVSTSTVTAISPYAYHKSGIFSSRLSDGYSRLQSLFRGIHLGSDASKHMFSAARNMVLE